MCVYVRESIYDWGSGGWGFCYQDDSADSVIKTIPAAALFSSMYVNMFSEMHALKVEAHSCHTRQ